MKPRIGVTSMLAEQYSVGAAYVRSIAESGGIPVILPALETLEDIPSQCEGLSGVLLIGGPDLDAAEFGKTNVPEMKLLPSVVDKYYLALARHIIQRTRLALLGICLGEQSINVALGGTLYFHLPTDRPEFIEHRRLNPPEENMHQVFFEPDGPLPRIIGAPSLLCNSSHHQAIERVAPGWRAVAHAPDGCIEAIAPQQSDGRFLLGVQWHPERLFDQEPHRKIFQAFVQAAKE